METDNFSTLRQRLEAYSLDDPDSTFPFSAKLAAEQGWTKAFCDRVIEEYKRFAFLSVAAGHPVSPSKAVDEVWHLHLTYTKSYWQDFCPNILGKPLHHNPTKGGPEESAKYESWYENTLASYERLFGEAPPEDIWARGPSKSPRLMLVDIDRNWVIRRPRLNRQAVLAGAAIFALTAVGCTPEPAGLNVFDWHGPNFLLFYLAFASAALILAFWLRDILRLPSDGVLHQAQLDGYQLAYLNQGSVLAVNAGVAALAKEGILKVQPDGIVEATGEILTSTHRIDRAIIESIGLRGRRKLGDMRKELRTEMDGLEANLRSSGLLVTEEYAGRAIAAPLAIGLLATGVGALKIMIGINRGRPVEFLVILTVVVLLITLIGFLRRPFRSKFGDRVLKEHREKYLRLRSPGRTIPVIPHQEMLLGLGIYGLAVLDGSNMQDLRTRLQPQSGSSSCGGGGGDGGGGGGGCGGCGGCGS